MALYDIYILSFNEMEIRKASSLRIPSADMGAFSEIFAATQQHQREQAVAWLAEALRKKNGRSRARFSVGSLKILK